MSWFSFGFGKKKKDEEAGRSDSSPPDDNAAPPPEDVASQEAIPESESVREPDDAPGVEPVSSPPAPAGDAEPVEIEAEAAGLVDPEAGAPPNTGDAARDGAAQNTDTPETADLPEAAPLPDTASQPGSPETADGAPSQGLFSRLASGLKRSSSRLSESVSSVFTRRKLDDEALEELEDLLIAADLGAVTAARVTARLARDKFDKDVTDIEVREALAETVAETLKPYEQPLDMSGEPPRVVVFVGVNGSGKTTTLGKIAVKMTREGGKVLNVAGDTFRAAAVEQLQVWSERGGANAHFMSREIGADAAGLTYDAVEKGRREGFDGVLIDTAGRLQNKTELMDELRKVLRVIRKVDETAPHHVILVLDGTVGSNAISQAEAFLEAANITGVIMTKLDGTAKGGALVQVAERFKLPIHYIGVGEGESDLQPFDARAFARALAGLES
ncbi:signal recognition particle-docking protein FtsY [Marinicauda sp. Alg238-R41]|uniref:signal recognition particle-docking protein FtsY n=1 Tax=Marinicauda sp. Alg238-R41 TaxID=2993447 RepID=UPI0022E85ED6|nr:signal recognition particle-docking protein FtsY [Marinicauda sp. Alg238-R41]